MTKRLLTRPVHGRRVSVAQRNACAGCAIVNVLLTAVTAAAAHLRALLVSKVCALRTS